MTHIRPVKSLETITLSRLLDHQFPAREDLITPWLRQGESAMLWAAPGVGKTLLTLTMALMVAGGGSALGWTASKPRKVLLVDGEMSAEDLQDRVATLMETIDGIDRGAARQNLFVMSRSWQDDTVIFPDLGDRDTDNARVSGQDVVFEKVRTLGIELVLADNFSTLVEVADENDASSMNATLAFLLRLKAARVGCVLVHHSGKTGESYRGSSKLATTFEVIIGLKATEGLAVNDGAAFRLFWEKYRRERSEAVRSKNVRLTTTEGQTRWVVEETADDAMHQLVAAVQTCNFGTQRALAASLGWDNGKVTRVKQAAFRAKLMDAPDWDRCMKEVIEVGAGETAEDF
jgi:hypothetical protein